MIKKCPICGKEFKSSHRKYCSDECSKEGQKVNAWNLSIEKSRQAKKESQKKNALRDIAKEAREAGMSYGQYVALREKAVFHRIERRSSKDARCKTIKQR